MEQNEIYNYLINKYKELHLLDNDGNIIKNELDFDYNIYPDDGYIPTCSVCLNEYNMWFDSMTTGPSKNNCIDMKHMSCGCLWLQFYKNKMISINPNIKFEKKKS